MCVRVFCCIMLLYHDQFCDFLISMRSMVARTCHYGRQLSSLLQQYSHLIIITLIIVVIVVVIAIVIVIDVDVISMLL